MDPPKAAHPHDPSQADRTTFEAAAGGEVVEGDGVNGLVWFEHSAYARAESSYQRWLADQGQAPGSSGRHGDPAACHRQVLPTWVNEGARLPDFGPAEPRPFLELFRSAPPAPGPAPGPAPAPPPGAGPGADSHARRPNGGVTAGRRDLPNPRSRAPTPPATPTAATPPGGEGAPRGGGATGGTGRGGTPRGRAEGLRGNSITPTSTASFTHPLCVSVFPPECQSGGGGRMSAVQYLAQEKVWVDKSRYDEAERRFYEGVNGPSHSSQTALYAAGDQGELVTRMRSLELENQSLHNVVQDLRSALLSLESRVALLERTPDTAQPVQIAPVHQSSDEEDEEAERIREERVKQYAEKKAKKPALIAKSSILLDVKPWDDETDMARLEECVRSVQADGLLWGSSKLVPVGYGIRKLQIQCVVEDDKVGTDMLEEEITKFEYYVQSVDVAAFNKI
ncbi:hypothetical protein COCON_G00138330 [Conger conger]|uniref:Elongation factor 1-delta n=1 Tax=Conger conger TaxID=82655 RepID=A0A9Q1HXV0_CONCO|nr:hypothetical protein COCON_G00138330 [Conger conger]